MKILYGVQGTGNGHIARTRLMAKAFAEYPDINVDYLFSGRDPKKYFDMDIFGDFRTREGLTFITEAGQLKRFKTVYKANVLRFIKDVYELDLSEYDLILNDFEPITAWAARLAGRDILSLSHQAAFKHPVPVVEYDLIDKLIMRCYAPSSHSLGVHWYHYGHPIIPPFVPADDGYCEHHDFILVYLPFESVDEIQTVLSSISETRFRCFHPDIVEPKQQANIEWNPTSKAAFHTALCECSGVIANGGFELATECLSIGKPLLVKPLNGQYEQFSNAFTLTQLDLCASMFSLNSDDIEDWLNNRHSVKVKFPSDLTQFIDWIIKSDWKNTQAICDKLWADVEFPQDVERKLETLVS